MILIPTKIIEVIENFLSIESDFFDKTEKQKNNLKVKLISLWYFIYNKQIVNSETLDMYINIYKEELEVFNIKIDGKQYGYNKLLDYLKLSNLIDINDKYSPGAFSKAYRIKTDFLQDTKYTEVQIDFKVIFKNIKDKKYWINKYPEFSNLIEDCYNTKVNLDEYIYWIKNNIGLELKPIIVKGILKKRYLTNEVAYCHITMALKINFKNNWFKLSDEGRFYSSISNLPSTALDFILFYNRSVKEIDIKNCQPLLLSTLVVSESYKKDVQDGIFYENVAKELNIRRNDFKFLSYKYIFFSDKPLKSGKIYDAMNKLYPTLVEQINKLREDCNLACRLQEIESDIFVNKLGKLNIRKLLRHDSVLINEEEYNKVCMFLENEFKKLKLNIKIN